MTVSDFITPLASTGDQGDLREALITRIPYTFAATENPEDYVAVDAGTGAIPWAVIWVGRVFYFDPDDNTSAHDGLTVIVTADGYRYKTNGIAANVLSVKSRDVTAPPSTPAIGDAYLVPAGATGDWATHPQNVAVWTARGWTYLPPSIGQLIFVEDETGFYHYGTAGAWVAGIGGSALGAGTVRASSLIGSRTNWVVVNQTTNTPPGSPANGVAYIVGPSPTGAWSGHTGHIAVWEISAWAFYAPQKGWTAFDQALNVTFVFNGAWLSQASGYDQITDAVANGSSTIGASGSGAYTFSTTAPTTSSYRRIDPLTLAVQAAFVGQVFEINYIASVVSADGRNTAAALFVDSEAEARDWQMAREDANASSGTPFPVNAVFRIALADTSAHVLRVAIAGQAGGMTIARRRLISRRRSA